MERLRIIDPATTLVDQVQEHLLAFFKEKKFRVGDAIPNENALAESLGVARSVVREALSRLRMLGLIESRPRRGMTLSEPSILNGLKMIVDPHILGEEALFNLLEFRIALEIGISDSIFYNITDKDILDLEQIVNVGEMFENNEYAPISEYSFHSKLYEITGNKTIGEFQKIIHPVMTFVKDKFKNFIEPINIQLKENNELVTHADLLYYLKKRDDKGYKKAIETHFKVYRLFIREHVRKKEKNE